MSKKILLTYQSVTGFTKEYAELIAKETGSEIMEAKSVTIEVMSQFDIIVFGGRLRGGMIDGLKKARKQFLQSKASQFLVFATGAAPHEAEEAIAQMWSRNFTAEELKEIPHFYMQSGLRYEKMPLTDKIMMKMFASMMQKKKNKSEFEEQLTKAIGSSYDISSRSYIQPLVDILKAC